MRNLARCPYALPTPCAMTFFKSIFLQQPQPGRQPQGRCCYLLMHHWQEIIRVSDPLPA